MQWVNALVLNFDAYLWVHQSTWRIGLVSFHSRKCLHSYQPIIICFVMEFIAVIWPSVHMVLLLITGVENVSCTPVELWDRMSSLQNWTLIKVAVTSQASFLQLSNYQKRFISTFIITYLSHWFSLALSFTHSWTKIAYTFH